MKITKVLLEIESMASWCLSTMVGVMIKTLHLRVEESHLILAQKKSSASRKARAPELTPFTRLQYLRSNNISRTSFVWTRDTLFYGETMTQLEHSYCQLSTECARGKPTVRVKKT